MELVAGRVADSDRARETDGLRHPILGWSILFAAFGMVTLPPVIGILALLGVLA